MTPPSEGGAARGRQPITYTGVNPVHCCICLNITSDLVPAVTVVCGYAVCEKHTQLASEPGFNITMVRRGGRKKAV